MACGSFEKQEGIFMNFVSVDALHHLRIHLFSKRPLPVTQMLKCLHVCIKKKPTTTYKTNKHIPSLDEIIIRQHLRPLP